MRVGKLSVLLLGLLGGAALVGCLSTTTAGRAVPTTAPVVVQSPVRAYLVDGSIVVYPGGATVGSGGIQGTGLRYSPNLTESGPAGPIALDSVIGVETFERTVNYGRTLLYNGVAAVGVAGLTTLFMQATLETLFGSCPTIYSDSAGTPVLEAESYSYSIAPLLEQRDVDRLRARADSAGVVRLEVRNEALETHYTDQSGLIEIRHGRDEQVFPVAGGGYVAVRGAAAVTSARDRAGRDVRGFLVRADELAFSTDDGFLRRASEGGETHDALDLVIPRPDGRDSIAVVLRMRSSLLSTVLLYEHMLRRPGARALDWMARDLGEIATLAELATWYGESFGLRVAVLESGGYREVARIMNVGPAAWHDVAAIVPAGIGDSVRIRLSFAADEWRIDRVATAADVRVPAHRSVAATRATDDSGHARLDVSDFLARTDGRRLETRPGQRYFLEFDVGREAPGEARTFLLATQGYYVEWVRGSWLKAAGGAGAFAPSPSTLAAVLRDWRTQKDSLEAHFFTRRVPLVSDAR